MSNFQNVQGIQKPRRRQQTAAQGTQQPIPPPPPPNGASLQQSAQQQQQVLPQQQAQQTQSELGNAVQQALITQLGGGSFEAQQQNRISGLRENAAREELQLQETLKRLGGLRNAGSAAEQLGTFRAGTLRGEEAIRSDIEAQRNQAIQAAAGLGTNFEALLQQGRENEANRRLAATLQGRELGFGREQLAEQTAARLGSQGLEQQRIGNQASQFEQTFGLEQDRFAQTVRDREADRVQQITLQNLLGTQAEQARTAQFGENALARQSAAEQADFERQSRAALARNELDFGREQLGLERERLGGVIDGRRTVEQQQQDLAFRTALAQQFGFDPALQLGQTQAVREAIAERNLRERMQKNQLSSTETLAREAEAGLSERQIAQFGEASLEREAQKLRAQEAFAQQTSLQNLLGTQAKDARTDIASEALLERAAQTARDKAAFTQQTSLQRLLGTQATARDIAAAKEAKLAREAAIGENQAERELRSIIAGGQLNEARQARIGAQGLEQQRISLAGSEGQAERDLQSIIAQQQFNLGTGQLAEQRAGRIDAQRLEQTRLNQAVSETALDRALQQNLQTQQNQFLTGLRGAELKAQGTLARDLQTQQLLAEQNRQTASNQFQLGLRGAELEATATQAQAERNLRQNLLTQANQFQLGLREAELGATSSEAALDRAQQNRQFAATQQLAREQATGQIRFGANLPSVESLSARQLGLGEAQLAQQGEQFASAQQQQNRQFAAQQQLAREELTGQVQVGANRPPLDTLAAQQLAQQESQFGRSLLQQGTQAGLGRQLERELATGRIAGQGAFGGPGESIAARALTQQGDIAAADRLAQQQFAVGRAPLTEGGQLFSTLQQREANRADELNRAQLLGELGGQATLANRFGTAELVGNLGGLQTLGAQQFNEQQRRGQLDDLLSLFAADVAASQAGQPGIRAQLNPLLTNLMRNVNAGNFTGNAPARTSTAVSEEQLARALANENRQRLFNRRV